MPIATTSVERNNFTRGLITEATALTFPENAAIDIDNFVLNRDGSIRRRRGLDYEAGNVQVDSTTSISILDGNAISAFTWKNADNRANVSIGVIQLGSKIWLVDLFASAQSAAVLNSGNPIQATNGVGSISGNTEMQFASINGQLVVASEELDQPIKISYDSSTDTATATPLNIQIRDIWGIDDDLDLGERPELLSLEHEYNLYNQGWPIENVNIAIDADGDESKIRNALNETFRVLGVYPANSDIIGQYRMQIADDTEAVDSFNPRKMRNYTIDNSPAPKGKYILDLFNRGAGRGAGSGLTGLPVDQDSGRLSVLASFANRVFYTGVRSSVTGGDDNSPDYSGTLFFTQTVETDDQLNRCYQVADPTSEFDSDLVATDGGVIKITGAGTILKLVAFNTHLLVFADNGVWSISGPDGVFKADDFSIRQISTVGCLNSSSVVVVETNVLFWGEGGIYAVATGEVTGEPSLANISETTIQSLYSDISGVAKLYAKGIFDSSNRTVRWLYNDDSTFTGTTKRYSYNKELVFDVTLQAFYLNTFADASTDSFVAAMFNVEDFLTVDLEQQVVVNGELVVVNGEEVVVTEKVRTQGSSTTKYLVLTPNTDTDNYDFSFAFYNNTYFLDWGETDQGSSLITGYELGGDTQRDKQVLYITTHFNRTETGFEDVDGELEALLPSSCKVQSRWDFSDSSVSNKWGREFQAYRLKRNYVPEDAADSFDYGYSVITTKTKLRGRGRAVSLRFASEAEKDCQLLGWAMIITGGQNV